MTRQSSKSRVDTPGVAKRLTRPPIPPELQLKWGLALLGEPAAHEYLTWLRRRLQRDSGDSLHTDSHTSTHNP